MSDDELDQVAGGTNAEFKELLQYLPQVEYKKWTPWAKSIISQEPRHTYNAYRNMTTKEAEVFLKNNFNIDAEIHDGFLFYGGANNNYSKDGVSISHAEVINLIKGK